MTGSRLTIRLVVLAVVAAVGWYIAHLHSQIGQLQGDLATSGKTAPAVRPIEKPAAAPGAAAKGDDALAAPRTLTPEQRKAMLDKLTSGGSANPIWFATTPNNAEAAAFQQTLQKIFEEAGWQVRGNVPVRFAVRPGIYVFAADEDPPDYVSSVQDGLEAAGLTIVSKGRGYRDFYKQKKEENPAWIGFEMAPDQTYVVVIGRKPEETATPQP